MMKVHEFFPLKLARDSGERLSLEVSGECVTDCDGPLSDAFRTAFYGKRLALEVSGECDGVPVTVCVGPLSDVFRTAFYGPLTDMPLPRERATDAEFSDFLGRAQGMTDDEFAAMLAEC